MSAQLVVLPTFTNEHVSVSRLRRYEECQQAFYFQYIDKGEREPQGEPAAFGTILHDALERTYAWVVEDEFEGYLPEEVLTRAYREAWTESAMVRLPLYQEGLEILRAYARDAGRVDHMNILSIEKEFNLLVGPDVCMLIDASEKEKWRTVPNHFVINGYIDRVDRAEGGGIEIVDYKSNRMLYTREEIDADLQMSVYGLVARQLYPWATSIGFAFHMIRHGIVQRTKRTSEQLADIVGYVIALGTRSERGPYPAKINTNCGYCDHRARCPEYKAAVSNKVERVAVTVDHLGALATERERVAKIAKAAYARKEELDHILRTNLIASGSESMTLAGTVYRLLQFFDKSYAAEPVVKILKESGIDPMPVLAIDSKALAAVLDRTEADDTVPKKVRDFLRVRIATKEVKVPQKPRLDARAVKK
jgi:putative RecB family exonuclease